MIEVSLDEFRAVGAGADRFVVAPGHELPDVERVVERNDRFAVVVRRTAPAAAAGEQRS